MKIEDVKTIEDLYIFCKDMKTYRLKDNDFEEVFANKQGVYIFFDDHEKIGMDLIGEEIPRIVRIGIVKSGMLANRLKNHKGYENNGGSHRSSAFRKLIGKAFINKENRSGKCLGKYPYWGIGSSAKKAVQTLRLAEFKSSKDIINNEKSMEEKVSKYIRELPFIVIIENDLEKRKSLEAKLIYMVSESVNSGKIKISKDWLGNFFTKNSGLWNIDGV